MPKKSIFHNLQKKRYRPDKYRNPYFRKHDGRRHWKRWGALLVGVAGILGAAYFFLSAPAFAITDVDVQGTETIDPANIQEITWDYLNQPRLFFFQNTNRFFFDKMILMEQLEERYAFESLDIERDGQRIRIIVEEKNSQLLWYTNEEPHLVDLQGTIIRTLTSAEITFMELSLKDIEQREQTETDGDGEVSVEEGEERYTEQEKRRIVFLQRLPKFYDINDASVRPGDSVLSEEEIQRMFRFHKHLDEQQIAYTGVSIDRLAGQWVSVETVDGYQILFDPLGDVDQQAVNLQTVFRERVDDPASLEYIDLRFDDHVYVK